MLSIQWLIERLKNLKSYHFLIFFIVLWIYCVVGIYSLVNGSLTDELAPSNTKNLFYFRCYFIGIYLASVGIYCFYDIWQEQKNHKSEDDIESTSSTNKLGIKLGIKEIRSIKNILSIKEIQIARNSIISIISFAFLLLCYILRKDFFGNLIFAFLGATIVPIVVNLNYVYTIKVFNLRLLELQEKVEIDMVLHEDTKIKSEKLLRLNQSINKRYYEQNLLNNRYILFTGIFCLIGSFIIIGLSFYFAYEYQNSNSKTDEKFVSTILGFTSGILTQFVAFIYLKIYQSNNETTISFYNKLNDIYFLKAANFIASTIEEVKTRDSTFQMIADNVVKQINKSQEPEKKEPEKKEPEKK